MEIDRRDIRQVLGDDLTEKLLRDSRNNIESTEDLGELADALIYVSDKKNPFFKRVKRTFTAQNKLGRTVFDILDLAVIFLPMPTPVKIINKIRGRMMDKPKLKSKSIWCAIILAVTAILQNVVGLDFNANPELVESIYTVIYVLASSFGVVGLRDAMGKIINEQQEVKDKIEAKKLNE